MQFTIARPDVIRAISQRWLLKFWQQHLGAHRVPCWQAAEGEDLSRVSSNLSFLDVIAGDDGLRFLIRFHGEMIGWAYGSPDCRGRYLHEDKPEPARALALAPYRQAVATGRPIYLIQDLTDRQGRVVHNERLLLPFAHDSEHVDRILASFEFICPDGGFDIHDLMSAQAAPPAMRLAAQIEPQPPA
jgi:hypothetical protein